MKQSFMNIYKKCFELFILEMCGGKLCPFLVGTWIDGDMDRHFFKMFM